MVHVKTEILYVPVLMCFRGLPIGYRDVFNMVIRVDHLYTNKSLLMDWAVRPTPWNACPTVGFCGSRKKGKSRAKMACWRGHMFTWMFVAISPTGLCCFWRDCKSDFERSTLQWPFAKNSNGKDGVGRGAAHIQDAPPPLPSPPMSMLQQEKRVA